VTWALTCLNLELKSRKRDLKDIKDKRNRRYRIDRTN
jgi:hypothetical protein